jgi:sugar phosphate isomerase/epimerase
VNELDEIWSQMLAESGTNARAAGRHALADYIALKASNDQIRERGVRWLFDSLIELAAIANRQNIAVTIEREEPHSFHHRGANMVGSLLRLRHGVRCLTLEAGWTRTPRDGFMRGQALAAARITHFGIKQAETELSLRHTDGLPNWFVIQKNEEATPLERNELIRHFSILIDRR